MKEDYLEFDIQYVTQDIAANITLEELALIESVMPDLILAMMQDDQND